jgi:hypothetical protein
MAIPKKIILLVLNGIVSLFLVGIVYSYLVFSLGIPITLSEWRELGLFFLVAFLIITGWMGLLLYLTSHTQFIAFYKPERLIQIFFKKTSPWRFGFYIAIISRLLICIWFILFIPYTIETWVYFLIIQESIDGLDSVLLTADKTRWKIMVLLDDITDWMVRSLYFSSMLNMWYVLLIIIAQFTLAILVYFRYPIRFLKYVFPDLLYFVPLLPFLSSSSSFLQGVPLAALIFAVCTYLFIYAHNLRDFMELKSRSFIIII